MKVLVIGATGRLGSEVVKALLQHGADVRVLTRKQRKPGAFPDAVEITLGEPNLLRDNTSKISFTCAMDSSDRCVSPLEADCEIMYPTRTRIHL